MARSIALVTRGTLDHEHLHGSLRELTEGTDRAVAIVGASFVETALDEALLVFLHRNKRITDHLFRPSGPIGAFSTKIHLGLLVGLYGVAAHRDLINIKEIRNAFAHSLEVRDFNTQRIRNLTMNLALCERYTADMTAEREKNLKSLPVRDWPYWVFVKDRDEALKEPRKRYILAMQVLTYGLMLPAKTGMPAPLF